MSRRRRGAVERGVRGLLAAALLAQAGLGCGSHAPPRNLLIIVIDTLRADALGLYGSQWPSSPRIDAFARESVVFDHAWAQGTYTPASFMSYMTSTHVRTHGWDLHVAVYPESGVCGWDDVVMLAEVLERAGFENEALVANFRLHQKAGFARGFARWNTVAAEAVAGFARLDQHNYLFRDEAATQAAVGAVQGWDQGARHFLYVHLMSPHLPLEPSPAALEALRIPRDWTPGGQIGVDEVTRLNDAGAKVAPERFRMGYAASVWDADHSVGQILDALERSGHRDTTIVALFSDHGEQIWEHGEYGHGRGVWEQLVHVPLILRVPGRAPARVSGHAVGLVDVAPTLTRLLGVAERPASWQGGDLLDGEARLPVVSERFHETAVTRDGRVKAVRLPPSEGSRWMFSDLERDPTEQAPLPWLREGAPLRDGFARFDADTPRVERDLEAAPAGVCRSVTAGEREELVEQLRALGYAE